MDKVACYCVHLLKMSNVIHFFIVIKIIFILSTSWFKLLRDTEVVRFAASRCEIVGIAGILAYLIPYFFVLSH